MINLISKEEEKAKKHDIIKFKAEKTHKQKKQEFRDEIVFANIAKTVRDTVQYDCTNQIYNNIWMRNFTLSQSIIWISYLFLTFGTNPAGVLLTTFAGPPAIVASFFLHHSFCETFVEKVTYLPKTKQFKLGRRSYYGSAYDEQVDIGALLYTNDSDLNQKEINYINMDNLKKYSIGKKDAWIDEHYFSYQIKQNIKLHMNPSDRNY